jgi:3-methylcrotonyl-CoA carboxylase alpha subunit
MATGHAIECRIYAENPRKSFMPTPGLLQRFDLPEQTPKVRIDSGFRSGDNITHFYDPMIAKVICHGETRNAAIERAIRTLRDIRIEGPATNLEFLCATLEHPAFREGQVFTGFTERFKPELLNA